MLVAPNSEGRRARAFVLTALLLVSGAAGLMTPVEAQVPDTKLGKPDFDLNWFTVNSGDVHYNETFVSNASTITLLVNVTNRGIVQKEVALVAFDTVAGWGGSGEAYRDCTKVNLGIGQSKNFTLHLRVPGVAVDDIENASRELRVIVNPRPTHVNSRTNDPLESPIFNDNTKAYCNAPQEPEQQYHTEGDVTDAWDDNHQSRFVVSDYRMNLVPRNFTVCRSDDSACGPGTQFNVRYDDVEKITFKFDVENEEPEDGGKWWAAETAPDGSRWPISWKISYVKQNDTTDTGVVKQVTHRDAAEASPGFGPREAREGFSLYGRGGNYSFTVEIDHEGRYREFNGTDNAATTTAYVRAPDLVVNATMEGDGTTPDTPLQYESGKFSFPVEVNLTNIGDFTAENASRRSFGFHVFVVKASSDPAEENAQINATSTDPQYLRWQEADFLSLDAGDSLVRTITIDGYADKSHAQHIGPGANKIVVIADPPWSDAEHCTDDDGTEHYTDCEARGRILERSEDNNRFDLTFYVRDEDPPRVSELTVEAGVKEDNPNTAWAENAFHKYAGATSNGDQPLETREGIPLHWRVRVIEDDASANVVLKLRNDATQNVTSYNMSRMETAANTSCVSEGTRASWAPCYGENYEFVMPDGIPDAANFRAWIEVTDSANNTGVHPIGSGLGVRVRPWAIHTLPETEIYLGAVDGAHNTEIELVNGTEFERRARNIVFKFRVPNNPDDGYTTGWPGPEHTTQNKIVYRTVCTEDQEPCGWHNLSSAEAHHMGSDPRCERDSFLPTDGTPVGNNTACDSSLFKWGQSQTIVGKHFIRFVILDAGGKNRTIERWFVVKSPTPEFLDVRAAESIELDESGDQGFNATVHVRGQNETDFWLDRVEAVYRHVASGHTVRKNFTLKTDDEANNTLRDGNWTGNVTVGWKKDLDRAGLYNVTYLARNRVGGTSENYSTFTVVDDSTPSIIDAGVTPSIQELEQPVTFYTVATDLDYFTVTLVIKRGNEEVKRVLMTEREDDPGNFTYTWNTTIPGDYKYTVQVADSEDRKPPAFNGQIPIVENLAPRFRIVSPHYVRDDGVRYGDARPSIQVLIMDKDGIVQNSVRMTINGINVSLTASNFQANENPRGLRVTYNFPVTSEPFPHNSTVIVNMTAQEAESEKMLTGYLEQSADPEFVVDALAPRSLPPILEGHHYHALDTDPRNISMDTVIRLTAEENADGAHTEVAKIGFKVWRRESSAERSIAPGDGFTFRELFDEGFIRYLGASPYKITFYAEDAVGNAEDGGRSFDVVLDDLAPFFDGYASELKGPHINASWTDEHSGMDRAAAMVRVGENGIYQPITLTLQDGLWSTTLSVGNKGDRVCYYLQAWDRVENVAEHGNPEDPAVCYEVGNRDPSLAITRPGDKAVVNGVTQIEWTSLDPDGDSLTFRIHYRLSGRQNFVELASLPEGTTSYALDTRDFPDGTYELQVTATDGSSIVYQNVEITIMNQAAVVEEIRVDQTTVRPGESVLITARVNKADANVEARFYREGGDEAVLTVAMRDDGEEGDATPNDGVYSALVTFQDGGTYGVEVFVQYQENGQLKEASLPEGAQFTVKLTAADVFSTFAGLWVALVALAVACVGIGGYALMRRWRM